MPLLVGPLFNAPWVTSPLCFLLRRQRSLSPPFRPTCATASAPGLRPALRYFGLPLAPSVRRTATGPRRLAMPLASRCGSHLGTSHSGETPASLPPVMLVLLLSTPSSILCCSSSAPSLPSCPPHLPRLPDQARLHQSLVPPPHQTHRLHGSLTITLHIRSGGYWTCATVVGATSIWWIGRGLALKHGRGFPGGRSWTSPSSQTLTGPRPLQPGIRQVASVEGGG